MPATPTIGGPGVDHPGAREATVPPPRWVSYAGAVLALVLVQRVLSDLGGVAAGRVDPTALDPAGWWARLSVHHATQGVLALALLVLLARTLRLDVGLRVGDVRHGLAAVGWVTAGYAVYLAALHGVRGALGLDPAIAVPEGAADRLGYLGFQLFLSGPSEELLFRALPVAVLAAVAPAARVLRLPVSREVLVAAALFALAHVTVAGGRASADAGQLATAVVLGTVQGVVLQRTRSVLYPMAIHSLTNVLAVTAAIVAA